MKSKSMKVEALELVEDLFREIENFRNIVENLPDDDERVYYFLENERGASGLYVRTENIRWHITRRYLRRKEEERKEIEEALKEVSEIFYHPSA